MPFVSSHAGSAVYSSAPSSVVYGSSPSNVVYGSSPPNVVYGSAPPSVVYPSSSYSSSSYEPRYVPTHGSYYDSRRHHQSSHIPMQHNFYGGPSMMMPPQYVAPVPSYHRSSYSVPYPYSSTYYPSQPAVILASKSSSRHHRRGSSSSSRHKRYYYL
ncbi:hypothetical protein GYMLUDRAFT_53045 [Collybiopsis luxurians FD-317 M1]|nr:hypothetical protein GYMLUDRAFT_53045 [Collybiopsis luxurians FD-317 M1]